MGHGVNLNHLTLLSFFFRRDHDGIFGSELVFF